MNHMARLLQWVPSAVCVIINSRRAVPAGLNGPASSPDPWLGHVTGCSPVSPELAYDGSDP
jgi:hypothetical protein